MGRWHSPREGRVRWKTVLEVVTSLALLGASVIVLWNELKPRPTLEATQQEPAGQRQPALRASVVAPEGSPARGADMAPMVLHVFSDFECPFCKRFAREVMPQLIRNYVDTGQLRIHFRHLPLTRLHAMADRAAEYAECAARQGRFWDFHDVIFARDAKSKLSETELADLAVTTGSVKSELATCVNGDPRIRARISVDQETARGFGIVSTPTFLIGRTTGDGKFKVDQKIVGAAAYDAFVKAFGELGLSPTTGG